MSKKSLSRLKEILTEEYKLYNKAFSFVEKRLELIKEKKISELQGQAKEYTGTITVGAIRRENADYQCPKKCEISQLWNQSTA